MYEYLSAYHKVHSCETTLINLVEGWRIARDNKLAVSILSTATASEQAQSIWFPGLHSTICKKEIQRISVLMRLRNLIPTKAKLVLFVICFNF